MSPFGERRSSEEPLSLELQRAQEHDRGRHAKQAMQNPLEGLVRHSLAHLAGDAAGPVIVDRWRRFILRTAFDLSCHHSFGFGLRTFFNPATIANDIGQLNDLVPANVVTIVHEQATRIASNGNQTLSLGLMVGILVSLWSAMSGVKAVIDALNVFMRGAKAEASSSSIL
jgi:membrane protein